MKKGIGIAILALMLSGCDNPSIIGEWIQPVPGMENQFQGINIKEGGDASSINMSTLVYKSWRHNGDTLTLRGESIGNGQTIEFSEKYEVEKLSRRTLILKNGGEELKFRRKDS